MPYPLSDEESSDSDNGVRFKTTNTRDKFKASSSSTSNKTKSYKNDYKHSLHVNSSKTKYYLDSTNYKELKSKGSLKHRYENSTSKREQDKYNKSNYSNTTPATSHSSNDWKAKRECTVNDHLSYKRKSRDNVINVNSKDCDNRCDSVSTKSIKEKDRFGKKCSQQTKKTTKFDNYSQEGDLLTSNTSLSPKYSTCNEEIILEFQHKSKVSEISDSGSKILSINKTKNSEIYEKETYFGPSLPGKYTDISKDINSQIQENQVSKLGIFSAESSLEIDYITIGDKKKYFGPSLPPKINITEETNASCDNSNVYGPSVPPHLKNNTLKNSEPTNLCKNKEKNSNNSMDPLLHHSEKIEKNTVSDLCINRCKVVGPILPDHLRINIINEPYNNIDVINEIKTNESDSEDSVIGPIPAKQYMNTQLEERALQIKLDLLNKTVKESSGREKWMLELPEIHSVAQVIGPRKFRAKEMPDLKDRSVWTDTAKDITKKKTSEIVDVKSEANIKNVREKDLIQEKIVEKQKKSKRPKSLIDLHNEELQKKKLKDNSATDERRPFSRDIDLKINRFDEAQTKAIIKKAHLLDSRFASGQSKFL